MVVRHWLWSWALVVLLGACGDDGAMGDGGGHGSDTFVVVSPVVPNGAEKPIAALGDVASGVTQTRSSAQTVLAASEDVENAAVKLRSEVEDFLRTVAA